MKAVFLDKGTFLDSVDLPAPDGISDYVTFDNTAASDDLIVERCKNADILITNKVVINANVIQQLPKLKLIQLTATGMNNVDKTACQTHGVTLYNVAGYAVKSVPEHTFMLMLTAMRAGIHYHHSVTNGSWQDDGGFCLMDHPLLDLEDKTLGIIGAGAIGRRVGEIATAFGMKVLWAEHQGRSPRSSDYTTFSDVLARSDVLSLHCPLTEATEGLINADSIRLMAQQPLIVNVARGGIVDSQAVVDAVQSGQLLGYASDVFAQEPMAADDPLRMLAEHPRVVFSPHNAWGSVAAQRKLWGILSQQVSEFVAQQ